MPELNQIEAGCPCDQLPFPPKPDIPAGLTELPRQLAGFPEFRLAMLAQIRSHDPQLDEIIARPLTDWRARQGSDLGVMLLEMWAYVLDVLAFYDERIANEAYLRTAQRPESLLRLVGLIGYHPKPALAARVTLALIAEEGSGPIAVPPGVAFRSGPFGDEPPQVFETSMPATIDPRRNEWTLAPIRDPTLGGEFFMNPGDAAIDRGDLALFQWGGAQMAATRVGEVSPVNGLDGNAYLRVVPETDPKIPLSLPAQDVRVFKPTLSARLRRLSNITSLISGGPATGATSTILELDSLQEDIAQGDGVIFVRGTVLDQNTEIIAARVATVARVTVPIATPTPPPTVTPNPPSTVPADLAEGVPVQAKNAEIKIAVLTTGSSPPQISVTYLEVTPALPIDWTETPSRVRIHFALVEAGRLTRPAKHRITNSDLDPIASFEGISEPLEPAARPKEVLLLGDDGLGARLAGKVTVDDTGAGNLQPDPPVFPHVLRTPVRVFGNLIRATRGESVVNEVLGSGNATLAFQKFALAKELTFLNDPSGPDGRRSTLQVRVNGLLWRDVPSFFSIGPDEEVYVVRRNPESGASVVTFGDGQTGARLPTGVSNVVASYRTGAGAAVPPANSITQLARPVPGIRGAENPAPAGGGSDGDRPKDLRRNAPNSGLLLGRAVSLEDFETLARQLGVVNAYADWTWDRTTQRAVVKVWFIPNSTAIAETNERELKAALLGQADPNTPLVACQAKAVPVELIVDLIVNPRFKSDDVERAVAEALTKPEGGILALENVPIGGPLFRSAILEQILSVNGVDSVRALTVDGKPSGATLTPAEGHFYNFLAQLIVGNTAAGDILFAKAKGESTSNILAFTHRD